jgi:hypothetical protein
MTESESELIRRASDLMVIMGSMSATTLLTWRHLLNGGDGIVVMVAIGYISGAGSFWMGRYMGKKR